MSDSVRPHRRQPTRLPRSWDSSGKNTGVGCHFLLQCMKVESESEVTQSCPTVCDPMDCSLSIRLLRPWDFPGKSAGVDCHFLLQGIFPIQESNPGLPHFRQTLYRLSHQRSPLIRKIEIKLPPFADDKTVENPKESPRQLLLLLFLSRFSRVQLCATP